MFQQPSRRALVIGNGAYHGSLFLSNPANDADSMGNSLEGLGFKVDMVKNGTYATLNTAIEQFIDRQEPSTHSVCLLYFSGHGIQINEQNYLVPIDYDSEVGSMKLIRLQHVIDQLSTRSDVRIVLLDACRSAAPGEAAIGARSLKLISRDRAIFIDGKDSIGNGLAAIEAQRNTFIGFAAAPGGVAYDGDQALSPFTGALVKYLGSVDLPLSNLTSRVRQEVLISTQGRQHTWDQSSLMEPFFFNPGTLLLYTGNLMAFVGLFVSLIPYSLVLWANESPATILYAGLSPLISLLILLSGMQGVYSRVRGKFRYHSGADISLQRHLLVSVKQGAIGGYIGSLPGAIFIAVPYHWLWNVYMNLTGGTEPESLGATLLEIGTATSLSACVLGTMAIFGTRVSIGIWSVRVTNRPSRIQTVLGASVGGAIAGALTAPFLLLYFGDLDRPGLTPAFLLPGAIVGSSIVIFTVVNFDFERLTGRRVIAGLLGTVGAFALGSIGAISLFGALYLLGVVDRTIGWLEADLWSFSVIGFGGLVYGTPVGLILGFTMGAAIVVTQAFSGRPVIADTGSF